MQRGVNNYIDIESPQKITINLPSDMVKEIEEIWKTSVTEDGQEYKYAGFQHFIICSIARNIEREKK